MKFVENFQPKLHTKRVWKRSETCTAAGAGAGAVVNGGNSKWRVQNEWVTTAQCCCSMGS